MKKSNVRTGNSSIFGSIVAAFCIIIYFISLVQAAVRLYLSIDNRRITAEREFSSLSNTALSAGREGFMDDRFVETMNKALSESITIEAIIISGPEGEYAFEKQQGRAVTWVNNSPRFINKFWFSGQNHYNTLPLDNLRNTNIRAKAGTFDYDELTKILKETLLLILIGFALSFFTMLLQLLTGGGKRAAQKRDVIYAAPPVSYSPVVQAKSEKNTKSESIDPSAPKGLYSPRGNIGWEEYTKDRLDSELHRCSSTEKDLTLLLMEFTDITNDTMFRQAAEDAAAFFKSRDLLFEYGKQGITAILPGTDLETGISKAEKFYQRIMEKFPHAYNSSSSLCIGISSRSGRLLDAERLMVETKEALKKAKNDSGTSIIAFKSDIDKYRAFIAAQDSRNQ